MSQSGSGPTKSTTAVEGAPETVQQAQKGLVDSISNSVTDRVLERLLQTLSKNPSLLQQQVPVQLQPAVPAPVPAVPAPAPAVPATASVPVSVQAKPVARIVPPHVTNVSYSNQLAFNFRVLDQLDDPSLPESPSLVRARLLLNRRSSTLIRAENDPGVFDALDKFEAAEALEAGETKDKFIEILNDRLKTVTSTKGVKRPASSQDGAQIRPSGGSQGGNFQLPFQIPFPFPPYASQGAALFGQPGPSGPVFQQQFGQQPGPSGASKRPRGAGCFNCGELGHLAKHCSRR